MTITETVLIEVVANCKGCGNEFSEFVRPDERPTGVCDECYEAPDG